MNNEQNNQFNSKLGAGLNANNNIPPMPTIEQGNTGSTNINQNNIFNQQPSFVSQTNSNLTNNQSGIPNQQSSLNSQIDNNLSNVSENQAYWNNNISSGNNGEMNFPNQVNGQNPSVVSNGNNFVNNRQPIDGVNQPLNTQGSLGNQEKKTKKKKSKKPLIIVLIIILIIGCAAGGWYVWQNMNNGESPVKKISKKQSKTSKSQKFTYNGFEFDILDGYNYTVDDNQIMKVTNNDNTEEYTLVVVPYSYENVLDNDFVASLALDGYKVGDAKRDSYEGTEVLTSELRSKEKNILAFLTASSDVSYSFYGMIYKSDNTIDYELLKVLRKIIDGAKLKDDVSEFELNLNNIVNPVTEETVDDTTDEVNNEVENKTEIQNNS